VDLSSDLHPQILLTFGGKYEHRESETIDAEEFIAKKGITAKGKKCSPYDLKSVEFGEPLHKAEDDETSPAEAGLMADSGLTADAVSDEAIDVADDFLSDLPDTPIEQTGQSSELLKGGPESDEPVDFGDWEPTLF